MIINSIDTNTDAVCSSAISQMFSAASQNHDPYKRDESQKLKSQTYILQLPAQS